MKTINFLIIFLFAQVAFGQFYEKISDVYADLEDAATLNDIVYFNGNDGIYGSELWQSDGTKEGTKLFLDIYKGSRFDGSSPSSFYVFKDHFYFIASEPDKRFRNVFKSDGTIQNTRPLNFSIDTDFLFTKSSSFDQFKEYFFEHDNNLYFIYNRRYFQKITAENGEKTLFLDIGDYTKSRIRNFVSEGKFIYMLLEGDDGAQLLKTDGTKSNTSLVNLPCLCGRDYYEDYSLAITDNGRAIFAADHPNYGVELWISDFTQEGTKMLLDLNEGGGSSYPYSITKAGNYLLFSIYSGGININSGVSTEQQYTKILNINTLELKDFKTKGGKYIYYFEPHLYEGNKVFLDAIYYKNDPTGKQSTTGLATQSGNFVFDFNNSDITELDFRFTTSVVGSKVLIREKNDRYYAMNSELFSEYQRYGSMLMYLDMAAEKVGIESVIPPEIIDNKIEDQRRLNGFARVKNGWIGSNFRTRYSDARQKGIYSVKSCPLTVDLKNGKSSFDLCKNNSYNLSFSTNNASGTVSSTWNFDIGFEAKKWINDAEIPVSEEGNYYLMVEDESGCAAGAYLRVKEIEGFRTELTADRFFCTGEEANISVEIIEGGVAPFTYRWFKDGSEVPGVTTNVFNVTNSGNYKVLVSDAEECSSEEIINNVTNQSPTNTNISGEKLLKVDQKTVLSVNLFSGQRYQWYKDDAILSSETTNKLTVAEPGNYKVEISNATCSVFSEVFAVDIITANEKLEILSVNIYPNPTSSTLIFNFKDTASEHEIDLLDSGGKLVKKYLLRGTNEIDISSIPAGTYLVSYRNKSQIVTKKLVKY